MESTAQETTGLKPIDVIERAWLNGISVQSNFFRDNAQLVAQCASMQYITTETVDGYSKYWRPTPSGVYKLFRERKFRVKQI
jgi:hypothetical protein